MDYAFRGSSGLHVGAFTGLLSNQGEKSINFYFIRVPLRQKVLKYGTPKPRSESEIRFPASFKGPWKRDR